MSKLFQASSLLLVLVVCAIFAIDSAAVVNGIQVAGQVGQVAAQATGHPEYVNLITILVSALTTVAGFFFGHKHGRKMEKKIAAIAARKT